MSIDVRLELRSLSRIAAVAAVACACFGSLAARAQEPSNAAVGFAREIILAKGVTTMTDPIVHGVIETVKNSFLPTNPNLSKELNEEAVVLHKEYDAKKNEVVDAMARAYARHFTEQELKDLILFYKTPLGQKFSREEGNAIEEGFRRAKEWSDTFAETVMVRMRGDMQKKGHSL